jgi:hypothetical protein
MRGCRIIAPRRSNIAHLRRPWRVNYNTTPKHAGVSKGAPAFHAMLQLYSALSSGADGTWRRRSILSWRIRTISIVLFGAARYIRKWLP